MPVISFPHLRPHAPPYLTSTTFLLLRRNLSLLTVASRNHRHHHNQQPPPPQKHLLNSRANQHHQLSTLSPAPETAATTASLPPNKAVGMVTSAQANFMRVVVEENDERSSFENVLESSKGMELLCVVRAVLKKIKRRVLVGDKVLVGSIDWIDRRGMIENVFPRNSLVLDPPIANADHFLVLFSMEQPKLESFSLTRFLIEAESTGIPLTLALNKCELVSDEVLAEWESKLHRWGYFPVFCSVESKRGLDTLAFRLRDHTTVIVGPSGVGKSSVINALRSTDPHPVTDEVSGSKWLEEQRVGEVSARSGRGKHTTRHVSLLPLAEGGYLADTPGFNQPSLVNVTKQSLAQAFPEIRKMIEENKPKKCAFNNCLHIGEPGCVVGGEWERYPYYLQLLDEIKIREEFQLRTLGTKREGDVRKKVGGLGTMQAEPRLEPKKHRRVSRKKMNQSILNELDELEDDEDDVLEDDPVIQAMEDEDHD